MAPRGTGSGTRGAKVGRSALAPPRPMVRSSHPGRRGVRGRAQRRSRCQASCPPASLCLTPAHPHPRSPAETPAAPALRRPRAHSPASPAESRPPRRVVALSWPPGPSCGRVGGQSGGQSHFGRCVPSLRAPAGGDRHRGAQARLPGAQRAGPSLRRGPGS